MHKSASPVSQEDWARLDARVRRIDEDRWLSSRYAERDSRRALIALYAFNLELAKVRTSVSEPMLGAIRFQWWRETIAQIERGEGIRRHDVAEALAQVSIVPAKLQALIDQYQDAFEAEDRTLEPDGLLAMIAAECVAPDVLKDWQRETELVGGAYGDAKRGDMSAHDCLSLKIPTALRPALAHARLVRDYAAGQTPGPLAKRFAILTAMLNGRV